MSLAGKTLFISGASRGIGKAIALRAARDGANVVVAAKTATPHPKLPGTIYTAADEIEKAGGKALPVVCDIRDEAQVQNAINQAIAKFGGIDILINNASAIRLTNTAQTSAKEYDLMNQINARGTWLVSKLALPHLRKATNPHILNLSPPLSMEPRWFQNHVAYTMAKFGMSMCVLGMAEEFRSYGIAVNALWPFTVIETAAMKMLGGISEQTSKARTPEIMADSAHHILTRPSRSFTGQFCIDEILLRELGVTDLAKYQVDPSVPQHELIPDFFVDDKVTGEVIRLRSGFYSKL
ncbi:Hydroxysteroid dehydrogenase-like protein 2 [Dimargaris cristalligena]|uniref:Hydroxysteroid dehydrogenase-like protein 2 n=1 Tax=Dimargaris cristalligena TaxID=215637 RepID=A0A4P9ZW64_9FUNG|nr:Hydroxysteroid dehydrogenase-like protein 2 [Dimargaris cristalligena]RKP37538.1 oxidoreductase [Dimargaris cristalligena]|eukprot:RKP37538.1 oxidoreductase [Dimargaris cristalligena]